MNFKAAREGVQFSTKISQNNGRKKIEINKHQMTIISKKTITMTIVILNNPSVQHILNKLVINFYTIQVNHAQNDACT